MSITIIKDLAKAVREQEAQRALHRRNDVKDDHRIERSINAEGDPAHTDPKSPDTTSS